MCNWALSKFRQSHFGIGELLQDSEIDMVSYIVNIWQITRIDRGMDSFFN